VMGFAAIPCLSYRIELHSIPPASLGLQDIELTRNLKAYTDLTVQQTCAHS
jgi:hypothetical protein